MPIWYNARIWRRNRRGDTVMNQELAVTMKKVETEGKITEKDIVVYRNNRDEAISHFLKLLRCMTRADALSMFDMNLFAGLCFLAENHVTEAFPFILELFSANDEDDDIFGDVLTEDLSTILYHTYGGDLEMLDPFLKDLTINPYSHGAAIEFMGQLYLDGVISREKLCGKLREYLEYLLENEAKDVMMVAGTAVDLHLTELKDILECVQKSDLFDPFYYGDLVPALYDKKLPVENLCRNSITLESSSYTTVLKAPEGLDDAVWEAQKKRMQSYLPAGESFRSAERYTFEHPAGTGKFSETIVDAFSCYGQLAHTIVKGEPIQKTIVRTEPKIGRNDPCPCGSGKKYKNCCMNKENA